MHSKGRGLRGGSKSGSAGALENVDCSVDQQLGSHMKPGGHLPGAVGQFARQPLSTAAMSPKTATGVLGARESHLSTVKTGGVLNKSKQRLYAKQHQQALAYFFFAIVMGQNPASTVPLGEGAIIIHTASVLVSERICHVQSR